MVHIHCLLAVCGNLAKTAHHRHNRGGGPPRCRRRPAAATAAEPSQVASHHRLSDNCYSSGAWTCGDGQTISWVLR